MVVDTYELKMRFLACCCAEAPNELVVERRRLLSRGYLSLVRPSMCRGVDATIVARRKRL